MVFFFDALFMFTVFWYTLKIYKKSSKQKIEKHHKITTNLQFWRNIWTFPYRQGFIWLSLTYFANVALRQIHQQLIHGPSTHSRRKKTLPHELRTRFNLPKAHQEHFHDLNFHETSHASARHENRFSLTEIISARIKISFKIGFKPEAVFSDRYSCSTRELDYNVTLEAHIKTSRFHFTSLLMQYTTREGNWHVKSNVFMFISFGLFLSILASNANRFDWKKILSNKNEFKCGSDLSEKKNI